MRFSDKINQSFRQHTLLVMRYKDLLSFLSFWHSKITDLGTMKNIVTFNHFILLDVSLGLI